MMQVVFQHPGRTRCNIVGVAIRWNTYFQNLYSNRRVWIDVISDCRQRNLPLRVNACDRTAAFARECSIDCRCMGEYLWRKSDRFCGDEPGRGLGQWIKQSGNRTLVGHGRL